LKKISGLGLIICLACQSLQVTAQTDSLRVIQPGTEVQALKPAEVYHSPHKATLYSAVLPGLGQAYNGKYWKIPIVYAALGSVVYGISFNTKYFNKYKTAYRDLIIKDPANTSYFEIADKYNISHEEAQNAKWFEDALQNRKKYYKRNRDLCYFGFIAVYVLNMIDASVDAHFFNYDISDDLSMQLIPQVAPGLSRDLQQPELGMKININF
jgi:hypothetical protein